MSGAGASPMSKIDHEEIQEEAKVEELSLSYKDKRVFELNKIFDKRDS